MRSSPSSALTSVDLPELGRPTMARRMGWTLVFGIFGSVGFSVVVCPCACARASGRVPPARPMRDRPGPRRARPRSRSARPAPAGRPRRSRSPPARPSHLLATRMTGRPDWRTARANAVSAGTTPSRASSTNSTRSARAIAVSLWARMRAAMRSRRRLLEPCRIDERHLVAGNLRLALAAVARQARHVGHERGALGRQPVEERRLADVGPADDGDGWGHVSS